MSTKSQLRLRLFAGILITVLAIGLYSQLPGRGNINIVYALTLVLAGAGIGAFLTNLFELIKTKD